MKKYLLLIIQKLGIKITRSPISGFEYLLQKQRYKKIKVNLHGVTFEIADSHSFYYSHREIFIDEIYRFNTEEENPVIIDCGSNYGTSIIYFKYLYPNSKIIGIEADPIIFKILESNIELQKFNNIQLLNKVLSNDKGPIQFFSEGADGGRIHDLKEPKCISNVCTIPLDDLINGTIDFLKMDIEGAETEVLCTSKKLSMVKQLFIEYHSFEDSEQSLGKLLQCLSENGFRYYIHKQFCSNKPFIEKETQLGMDLQLNIFAKQL